MSIPPEPPQVQDEPVQGAQNTQEGEEPEWALPEPSELCRPPGGGTARGEIPSQMDEAWEGEPSRQESLSPEQRIVEADKRRRKRLAALAMDHIVKLREERQRMAYDWLEEYSMQASSAKLSGIGLGTLRAEYIHRYNRLLDHEKQPH